MGSNGARQYDDEDRIDTILYHVAKHTDILTNFEQHHRDIKEHAKQENQNLSKISDTLNNIDESLDKGFNVAKSGMKLVHCVIGIFALIFVAMLAVVVYISDVSIDAKNLTITPQVTYEMPKPNKNSN